MNVFGSGPGIERRVNVANNDVDVIVAPRGSSRPPGIISWFRSVAIAIRSLLTGMRVTAGYLFGRDKVVTQQYPENRETLEMNERFRGRLKLTHDDNGYMNCNGCKFCEIACPNQSIIIKDRRNPVNDKSELDQFIWRLDTCTFCNACIQVCPHDALEWGQDFEGAVYDRRLLVYTLNSYAGPQARLIERAIKKDEQPEELKATIEPRSRYGTGVPLAGDELPGVPALGGEDKEST